jgi:hypothetical protein
MQFVEGKVIFSNSNQTTGTPTVTTRMTLDNDGNLLVGTTDTFPGFNDTNTGTSITSTGRIFASASGDFSQFNRNSSDGDILHFRKDGSEVGSIGTLSGLLGIGNGDAGLLMAGSVDAVAPYNASTNATRDAAIDLGTATNRFKDLYLSNGVDLNRADGGTQVQVAMKQAGTLKSQLTSNFGDSKFYLYHQGGNRLVIDGSGKIAIGNNVPMWSGSYGGGLFLKGNNATSDRYAQLCIVDSNGDIAQTGLKINNNGSATFGGAGDVTITDGNLVVASGHGIDFSAHGHAGGMTSELLDDYEEGTWTPTAGFTLTINSTCRYTKVGGVVTVTFDVTYATGTDGSYGRLESLPFSSYDYSTGTIGFDTATNRVTMSYSTGTYLYLLNATTNAYLSLTDMSGIRVIGSCTYLTN